EMTDPDAQPVIWVIKWVDYSDKYGFAYQLSDDGVGVMFNDGTRLIMLANCFNIHYINRDGNELYYTVMEYPPELDKKMRLMNLVLKYMKVLLMKAGSSVAVKPCDSMSRIPYMHQWFRTQSAVVMQLTNGTVQRFQIQENGCCKGLAKNLEYAYEKLVLMLSNPQTR
ncbi:serine/threonine-protein kinase polo-like, partial [Ceratina calcarata]|uniref:Serine/threonine-protein kinase polo-like n=1 Tax=Ceratina calcarata TaxID=156304 RepID=A0AAJ7IXQ3_9HYME